ncbi:MAG TPA: hypothetical protein DCZ93_02935 [Elusimicrobia bacterium]|nr:hypothetical protein [Elusimicrobiota bacterium]
MIKMICAGLLSAALLGGAAAVYSQIFQGAGAVTPGGSCAAVDEAQKAALKKMAASDPGLYAFESRLYDLRKKANNILKQHKKKKLSKDAAKELLVPLLEEEQDIQKDPEYLAEQRLLSGPR